MNHCVRKFKALRKDRRGRSLALQIASFENFREKESQGQKFGTDNSLALHFFLHCLAVHMGGCGHGD